MKREMILFAVLLGLFGAYGIGYIWARMTIFHTVEYYTGAEGKAPPRQDYIAKRDLPPRSGWEYYLFLPLIKIEEGVLYVVYNR